MLIGRDHGPWETVVPDHRFNGDGLIAFITSDEDLRWVEANGLPTVNVSARSLRLPFAQVIPDSADAGRRAAEHLIERGFRSFGFCGYRGHGYSDERCEGYTNALVQAGYTPEVFSDHTDEHPGWTWEKEQAALTGWLKALPRPVAIAAANDARARQVCEAAQRISLSVPEELAIIGFDNDEMVCQMGNPPLSSVEMNYEEVGYRAAAVLDGLMNGAPPPDEVIRVPGRVGGARASTDILAIDDPAVAAALHFIWQNAHRPTLAADVVEAVPTSRRVIERRFKRHVGRTLHEEIQRVHVNRAKQLLRETRLASYEVAQRSGFHDAKHFNRVFKQAQGVTPLAYRHQHGSVLTSENP